MRATCSQASWNASCRDAACSRTIYAEPYAEAFLSAFDISRRKAASLQPASGGRYEVYPSKIGKFALKDDYRNSGFMISGEVYKRLESRSDVLGVTIKTSFT